MWHQRNHTLNFDISGLNILTIIFIILKLCHVINWSWWFVITPTILFFLSPFLIVGLLFGVVILIELLQKFYFKIKK